MLYSQLISIEHLLQAWEEFKVGKRNRKDVQFFERNLENNLFFLNQALIKKTYHHFSYTAFNIYDPKFRHIHKALVRDRIVHHAVVSLIEPIFDKIFIYDSYSCRKNKGTHKAVDRLEKFTRIVSKNYTRGCWALKLDIKKFFPSVDHEILVRLLNKKVTDPDILWLLMNVIESFQSDQGKDKGIPLGNLTSQVFANIYMNELDQFIKHKLKVKYYLRYADDFVIISSKRVDLDQYLEPIISFLNDRLKLCLHPKKIILRKLSWGIDFLGYIVLPHYILPRTKTKRRMFKKLEQKRELQNFNQSLQAYLGYLKHANSFKIKMELFNFLK